ncbi:hypothetical protein AOXY_G3732 [Acipenser oxyrinchus oxyrinchus]|uniref:Uncharacterized protein n=1 Tax=Acipenser oxyrinchus oxyrinchus TaxID=40147 RepID=A0AAD8GFL2_ACIOX|nr:hypothetical protein AOXY_G3732 [Acipenser oxyrinchus oxyrinchus]
MFPLYAALVETATSSTLGQQSSAPHFATFPVTGTTPRPPRSGCPREKPQEVSELVTTPVPVTISVEKLNPCMLELCKFFQQCLCRVDTKKLETRRYCTDYHSWYLKYTKDVCKRVKQIPFSQTLRQKCLARMCKFT